jgi:hypothetical protein
MQLIDRNTVTGTNESLLRCPSYARSKTLAIRHSSAQRLLAMLSVSLVVVGGPAVLNALAETSLASIQVFLEICRFGLVAYQILGR